MKLQRNMYLWILCAVFLLGISVPAGAQSLGSVPVTVEYYAHLSYPDSSSPTPWNSLMKNSSFGLPIGQSMTFTAPQVEGCRFEQYFCTCTNALGQHTMDLSGRESSFDLTVQPGSDTNAVKIQFIYVKDGVPYSVSYRCTDGDGGSFPLAESLNGTADMDSSVTYSAQDFPGFVLENVAGSCLTAEGSYEVPEVNTTNGTLTAAWNTVRMSLEFRYRQVGVPYEVQYRYYNRDNGSFTPILDNSEGIIALGDSLKLEAPEIEGYSFGDISYYPVQADPAAVGGSPLANINAEDQDYLEIIGERNQIKLFISFNYGLPEETEAESSEDVSLPEESVLPVSSDVSSEPASSETEQESSETETAENSSPNQQDPSEQAGTQTETNAEENESDGGFRTLLIIVIAAFAAFACGLIGGILIGKNRL